MERLKRNLVLALGFALAVYLGLAIYSGLGDLLGALERFRWSLVPVIFGLVALANVGRFFRWSYYLRVLKVPVPLRYNAPVFAAGLSMTISPGQIGEVIKTVFLRQLRGTPLVRTAPTVVAERLTDGTGMAGWGILGALSSSFGFGALIAFLAYTLAAVAILRSRRFLLLIERVIGRIPLLRRLVPHLDDLYGASSELLGLRALAVATAISFCAWGLEITAVYLCVAGIGASVPFLVVVFIFAVGKILGSVTMLPGGIGATEVGITGMFVTFAGLASGLAVALALLIQLATVWFATLIGIAGLLVVRSMLGGLDET